MTDRESLALRRLITETISRGVVELTRTTAGLTHAATAVAMLDDDTSVFVKAGLDEQTADDVRKEIANLSWLSGNFVPAVVAVRDDPPVLLLEDLSHGHWPEPYPEDLSGLEATLAELRELDKPPGKELDVLEPPDGRALERVAASARLAVPAAAEWIAKHLPDISAAIATIGPPDTLVHSDLWYPNICFLPDRVVFVDWSHLSLGSKWADASTVSIDLVIEGRPPLPTEDGAGWAAAYIAWVVNALAAGPSEAISDPDLWTTDNLELFDGAAFWLADELDVEPPPAVSNRNVGY